MQDAPLPVFLPFVSPFSRIDTVEWRAAEAQQDLLYLQVDIALNPPPPTPRPVGRAVKRAK